MRRDESQMFDAIYELDIDVGGADAEFHPRTARIGIQRIGTLNGCYQYHSSCVDSDGANLYIFGGSKLSHRDAPIKPKNLLRTNTLQILRIRPNSLKTLSKRALLDRDCRLKSRSLKVVTPSQG